ncbi:DNA polymerase III subunit gamma and tau [Cellulomonas sp.]|uniref:DNA polymerase III subunit gamma and tau n=1 Tax=Cellulomonas sp. TaxID=40001 RepID=UPI002D2944EA|nr:DNA polymerase III subunit gamma and tau [Cellulomonas sp.]HYQ74747.1 DNA polymerase III subunit gamma and tau [Cellulomonas sp.]
MTTALYRRYRPETFAEVVGQDHVTAPLRQALRTGQTNHAYLFSGPRGCGKTTSARILARCLNCAEGPTDTPCGVCPSCVELARGGPGSLDVVEIDAASHGGVDDARDLRERATFAPARDRYKVFILDEAHMVSPQGFNALLKIVEEPPEHVKFIFATTEPDKVIGTIRSRTHHYPFRLVPPDVMVGYLDQLCTTEGVTVGSGVLPLVVRAGGGSVRDSLSVLDQLIAGSGPDGLVYEDAVALLGYTHASLLDDLVEAIAARDGASAFRVVERVISTGHEPRRFVEDLLERLRDLIVLAASGDAAAAVLRDVPGDQMARMQQQAAHLGAAELSRSADLVNAALSEMTGATSPRLHLELLMARLLLPVLDDSAAGIGARVDRLEREGVRAASGPAGAPVATAPPVAAPAFAPAAPVERVAVVTPPPSPAPEVRAAEETLRASGAGSAQGDDAVGAGAGDASGAEASGSGERAAGEQRPDERRPGPAEDAEATAGRQPEHAPADERYPEPEVAPVAEPARAAAPAAPAAPPAPAAEERPMAHDVPTAEPVAPAERPAGAPGGGDTEMLRRRWPEVLDTLARLKKTTWVLISQNAQVVELDATTLKLGFGAPGLASAFRSGPHADLVQQAVRETLGFSVKVEPVLSGGGPAAPRPGSGPAPSPAPAARGGGAPSSAEAAASWDAPAARPAPVPSPVEAARAPHDAPAAGPSGVDAPADDDPDAADPWSSATVTPAGGGTAGEGAADGASDDRADGGDPAGDPSRAAAADGRGVREDAARGGVAREGAGAEAFGERASGEIAAEHASGDRASGDVAAGDRASGDIAAGDVAAGERASAETVSADLASGGSVPGGPASGGPASGGPEADGPASAGRAPGDSASARSAAGDAAPGAPVRGGSPSGGSAPAAAPVRPPAPVVAVSDDGWPAVAPLGGARPASSTPGAPAADSGDGARPDDPASAARDRVASAEARADGPGRPGVDGAPASARARGAEALAGSAAPGAAASGPAARPGSDDRSGSDDRPATRASGSGRPAARPAPTDPGAPPPWDPHPDDPGAPEPPDDDWARDVPLPPDPGPDPYAAPSRPAAAATAAPSPAPTSGADRVRAAARAAAAGGGSVATAPRVAWADDEPSMDDPDIGSSTLSGIPLLAQALGATVIDEPVDEGF